ncbi:MAG: hypothetical protein JWP07_4752 [Pseudonocardiales bacterium]|nr:hypothetical protein [Pseudonocardiales bacterium]
MRLQTRRLVVLPLRRSDDDHQQDHEGGSDQIGESGESGRAGHGQGPEPVDDALAMSSDRPTAVEVAPNTTVCTMMRGSDSRHS